MTLPTCRTPLADGDRCRNCGWLLADHPPDPQGVVAEVATLRERIDGLEQRLDANFTSLDDFVQKVTDSMEAEVEWVRDVERRLSALEAPRKKR